MPRGIYEVGTVVRIKEDNQFAIIRQRVSMYEDPNNLGFLHYMIGIEGRNGLYAGYDDDFELECLPPP